MMSDVRSWSEITLGRVSEIVAGYAWSSNQFNLDRRGLPIIRIQNVTAETATEFVYWDEDYDDRFLVRQNDLLLSLSGSFRVCEWHGPIALLNQRIVKLTPNAGVCRRWLFYAVQSLLLQIQQMGRHALISNVSLVDLRELRIELPAISEQQRIVEILDQADALRQQRADTDAKVQRILPSFFETMFGSPATNSKNWPLGIVDDVLIETQYGTSTRASDSGAGIPLIRMNNIDKSGKLDLSNLKHVELPAEERGRYLLEEGDILFNRTNSRELVGKTGLWKGGMEAVPASYLIRVRVNRDVVLPEFFWAYMNTPFMKNALFDKSRRAIGMANINAQELRGLVFMQPPRERQLEFARCLKSIEATEAQCQASRQSIEKIWNVLLHRAFTGELTAKWREAHREQLEREQAEQLRVLQQSSSSAPPPRRERRTRTEARS